MNTNVVFAFIFDALLLGSKVSAVNVAGAVIVSIAGMLMMFSKKDIPASKVNKLLQEEEEGEIEGKVKDLELTKLK